MVSRCCHTDDPLPLTRHQQHLMHPPTPLPHLTLHGAPSSTLHLPLPLLLRSGPSGYPQPYPYITHRGQQRWHCARDKSGMAWDRHATRLGLTRLATGWWSSWRCLRQLKAPNHGITLSHIVTNIVAHFVTHFVTHGVTYIMTLVVIHGRHCAHAAARPGALSRAYSRRYRYLQQPHASPVLGRFLSHETPILGARGVVRAAGLCVSKLDHHRRLGPRFDPNPDRCCSCASSFRNAAVYTAFPFVSRLQKIT